MKAEIIPQETINRAGKIRRCLAAGNVCTCYLVARLAGDHFILDLINSHEAEIVETPEIKNAASLESGKPVEVS